MSALTHYFRRRLLTVSLWQGLFVLAVVGIVATYYLTLHEAMQSIRFVAMDSRGTMYITSLGTFETADDFRIATARDAVEAIFNRNPNGLDNQKRVELLFNTRCSQLVRAQAAKDADEFRLRQIHQKVETGKIKAISISDDRARMSVECQVLRQRVFEGHVINDSQNVLVLLELAVNHSPAISGKFPIEVVQFDTRYL
jgi:hypothetical protein